MVTPRASHDAQTSLATSDAEPSAADWISSDHRDGHPDCSNPECGEYPYYGVAPHKCFYKRGAEFTIGQSIGLPAAEWPPHFEPDLAEGETAETVSYPNACGTYHCPTCSAEGRTYRRASPKDGTAEPCNCPGGGEP